MKWKWVIIGLILVLSVPLVSAESSDAKNKVTVQLKWRHQFQFAGYYAAIEQGYYQDKSLQVTLLERTPGPTPIDRLILGHVDYAVGGVGALVYRFNDVPLVALAAIYQHSPSVLISRYPELSELKGKKVMLSRGVMNAEIVAMLDRAGLELDDIDLIPSNQSLTGFIDGKIDAYNGYSTNEPFLLNRTNTGFYSFKPTKFGVDFYGDILLTSQRKLDRDPQQVKDFREATIKGWQYAIDNIDETVDLILTKYNSQNKSREQLQFEAQELVKLIYSDIVPIGYMNETRWLEIGKLLQAAGELQPGSIDLSGFLYQSKNQSRLSQFIDKNAKALALFFALTIAGLLLLHNSRLKLIVRQRTQDLIRANEAAEKEARTDPLTGLANRRHFLEEVGRTLAIAKRNNLVLSLVYIDVDFFKKVNDSLGHAAGDEALKGIADILRANVRSADTPCRTGGEEFIVICVEKSLQDSQHLAERIRKEVEEHLFSYQNDWFHLTVSIGVASVNGEDDLERALKKSDEALYKAKVQGRNQVQLC